ncbi:MAG: sigma-70 family RNA polymerase sigma factor [Gammaproteobacteria bacterium]|nr:sigma-70 family RNA polymerase sigma factor [Gammaproteobacteria bacterium]
MFNKDELNQLYRYALSLSKHEDGAYDLVQTAIERLLRKPTADVALIEKPLAYLKVIIRNLYFDLERHKKVLPMISIETDNLLYLEPVDDNSMEDVLINQQEVQLLIGRLNAQENELLYLWAVEEHTVEEIAAIYEKPRGTMLSKLHRLKKRIREQLQLVNIEVNVMSNKQ